MITQNLKLNNIIENKLTHVNIYLVKIFIRQMIVVIHKSIEYHHPYVRCLLFILLSLRNSMTLKTISLVQLKEYSRNKAMNSSLFTIHIVHQSREQMNIFPSASHLHELHSSSLKSVHFCFGGTGQRMRSPGFTHTQRFTG